MTTASASSPIPMPIPIPMAVIGTGAMGRHHVRLLSSLAGVELVGIYDDRAPAAAALAEEHGTTSFTDLDSLLERVEAVVLAVPTSGHRSLGCRILERGLHLLVEKPIASTLEEADSMIAAAAAADCVLGVGHVEFYNPAVRALLEYEDTPRYIEVQRLSPFSPRSLDVDVLRDLMIHDLQLLHVLDPSPIDEVRAIGIKVLSPQIDMVNARLELASGLVANVTASRVAAEPTRKLRVFLHHAYISLDYREQEMKGAYLDDSGDRRIVPLALPPIEKGEPLKAELEAFVAVCRGQEVPFVDGKSGRRALETALAIGEAIAQR